VTLDDVRRVSGSLRLRYFGPRPLIEDNTVRSGATTLLNLEMGYRLSSRLRLTVDALNLLNAKDSDIDYFYTSRLPGEPAVGVEDVHLHPTLPRTVRIGLRARF
jgi:outer membrane receptor protein involved in Fe transport